MVAVLCVGHAVQDFVFSMGAMPTAAEKYRASGFESVGGGPAATAAVAISKLGGAAKLASRTGADRIGDIVIAELEAYDVDCSLVRRFAGRTSSLSAVVVDNEGERLIVNYLDPSLESEPDWLPKRLPDGIDAVLADTRWPQGSLHAFRLARASAVPAVLDADQPVPKDGELVRAASHVAFSASGLSEFVGNADPAAALREVAAMTDAWCCVTLGGEGTLYIDDAEVCHAAAYEVTVRDTLGAGDVWHGAFALALGEGQPVKSAMSFAAAAAALKVANGRGRAGAPARREVDEFMAQHGVEKQA